MTNFVCHVIHSVVPKNVAADDPITIWESCYLVREANPRAAQSKVIEELNKTLELERDDTFTLNDQPANYQFEGVRMVLECDSDFQWASEYDDAVIEVTYIEYQILYKYLPQLVAGNSVDVCFTSIERRG